MDKTNPIDTYKTKSQISFAAQSKFLFDLNFAKEKAVILYRRDSICLKA
jgi:hypothetical protein